MSFQKRTQRHPFNIHARTSVSIALSFAMEIVRRALRYVGLAVFLTKRSNTMSSAREIVSQNTSLVARSALRGMLLAMGIAGRKSIGKTVMENVYGISNHVHHLLSSLPNQLQPLVF